MPQAINNTIPTAPRIVHSAARTVEPTRFSIKGSIRTPQFLLESGYCFSSAGRDGVHFGAGLRQRHAGLEPRDAQQAGMIAAILIRSFAGHLPNRNPDVHLAWKHEIRPASHR